VRANIADPAKRSHAVTTANFGAGNGLRLRDWMTANAGVTLGIPLGGVEGPGGRKEDFLRIGHMGHVNAHMVLGVLANLQAGMAALQIPHGAGGLDAAVSVIAEG
jgi:alanine-glyoxylate transaminase/serine-glyoxylate transaminase/serine-pyruvate transaminase